MVGQQVNVTFTYIDLATASRQSHSEVFTVAGIMKPVGNPTIDRAVVFNLEAGNKLFQKSGRYDSLFVGQKARIMSRRLKKRYETSTAQI